MKRLCILLLVCALLTGACAAAMAEGSPVPDTIPADYNGKTPYGYFMELKTTYLPAQVFTDAVRYSDQDRENARRAAKLIITGTTSLMEKAGAADQYNLYLRAYAYDLTYQDGKDPAVKQLALADYLQTVSLGGSYAQADHDRLNALTLAAAPVGWTVSQVLTLGEAGEVVGVPGGDLTYVTSDYARADGSRLGIGYALRSVADVPGSAFFLLADPQGGKARYEVLKRFAFLNQTTPVQGLGEEAVAFGHRQFQPNGLRYATVLVLKDPLVLQVCVPDRTWRGPGFNKDPEDLAYRLAERFLKNLADAGRAFPAGSEAAAEDLMPRHALPEGTADSPVPGAVPADFGGKTAYGYLMDLKSTYLKPDAFANAAYTEADRNNARRALKLVVSMITDGFADNGPNMYELEIRAACYTLAFADTGDPVFRQLALNDLKQALSQGYALAKPAYDTLATPLLSGMAELAEGAKGGAVLTLQQWLGKAGYPITPESGVMDAATVQAVAAYEAANDLTADGIADIAFLLSLYAKVDDGDMLVTGL